MENKENILEKTLREMPNAFTSNAFNKAAVKNGIPKSLIENTGLYFFLKTHATNACRGSKTWMKNIKTKGDLNENQNLSQIKVERIDVDVAIRLLKSLGYKVLKPVNEWKEC